MIQGTLSPLLTAIKWQSMFVGISSGLKKETGIPFCSSRFFYKKPAISTMRGRKGLLQ